MGAAGDALVTRKILVGHQLLNHRYDAAGLGFAVTDNLAPGPVSVSGDTDCATSVVDADPAFVGAASGDFHATAAASARYGACAP